MISEYTDGDQSLQRTGTLEKVKSASIHLDREE